MTVGTTPGTAAGSPLPDDADRHSALHDFQHNLVVTAGAGTGKTSLLVGRLLAALVRHHMEPHEVLALTFTENAAREMRERLVRMLAAVRPWLDGAAIEPSDAYILATLDLGPEDVSRVDELLDRSESLNIATFHGFCLTFLQEHARLLGLPPDIRIDDTAGQHPGFDEVFLDWLREASDGEVHPALERFEPSELRDLAREFLALPEDSMDRLAAVTPPDDLQPRRDALRALATANPEARANWHTAAADFVACYDALLAGTAPHSTWIHKAVPKAGKRELGAERNDELTRALQTHRDELRPWVLADQPGIALAVDFVRPVLRRYRDRIAASGEVGFQDLLLLTRRALLERADLRTAHGRRLRAILVDEFQDTDPLQYDVVFLLGTEPTEAAIDDPMQLTLRPGILFIVGDAKQSIYRFRRADVAAFARAMQCVEAQDGRQLALRANFRSTAPILALVNSVCATTLVADPPFQFGYDPVEPMLDGAADPVEVLQIDSDQPLTSAARRQREGAILVDRIQALHRDGLSFGEMTILLRATTETSWILRPLRDAGVPYILDGSRRFFQRQEILLATALLSCVSRPHDPVATLAILRSSLSSATDADLLEYTESGGSLDFRAARRRSGPVAGCLTMLAGLHARVADLPVDRALTLLLTLPELRLAEGAGFEGSQRLANLERLLQKLLRRNPLDLLEAATFLSQQTEVESDDEESPLFDRGVQAVRVMTVHKAKGLEFGAVFLPDLARRSSYRERSGAAQAQRLFDSEGREFVTVRIGDTRNAASLLAKDAGRRHDEAEQRRLFYVATTRAKRRLILLTGEPGRDRRLWQDDLAASTGARFAHRLVADGGSGRGAAPPAIDPQPALRAAAAHATLQRESLGHLRGEDVAPSQVTHAPQQLTFGFATADDLAASERPASTDSEDALTLGNEMHAYLALADITIPECDEEVLGGLRAGAELRAMAERFHRSELRVRLAAASRLHREVPVAYVRNDRHVHGVIDLIVEEDDGVTILDWKTSRLDGTSGADKAEEFREQLTAYGYGVQLAMGLAGMPGLEVHFLRDDVTQKLDTGWQ